MPKRFQTNIGPRDLEILTAFDRTPLTPAQLCLLSEAFAQPFRNEHNLRRRLRRLASSGLVRSWPYALVAEGRAPRYFKLTRDGYRLLYGEDAALPSRRYFEEVRHGHHHHTNALAHVIVHIAVRGHRHGITLRHFARENSIRLTANGCTVYPDCGFQLVTPDGRTFNYMLELDNGTERIRTRHDVESIERKLRTYDQHQSQFAANDPGRYLVLFVTTRSEQRLNHILALADAVMTNRQRTVFVGASLRLLLEGDSFRDAVWHDHRGLRRVLVPLVASDRVVDTHAKANSSSEQSRSRNLTQLNDAHPRSVLP